MPDILIYGAGGFAREVLWLIAECNAAGANYHPAGFVDDDPSHQGQTLAGLPVMGLEQAGARFPGALFTPAIGSPLARQAVTERALAQGLREVTLIHPATRMSPRVEVGAGSVICAGSILTVDITLGRQVQINLDCTIGHDVRMGDFATLAPGVHVSGWVFLGARTYIGTGAVIINGTSAEPLVIGDDTVVGAGACVTRSLAPGVTAVGVPARPRERK